MKFEFTNPLALVLLLFLPVAFYLARGLKPALGDMGKSSIRLRTRLIKAVRIVLLLVIVLALAGFRIRTHARDLAVIFLVDVSASVPLSEQRAALDFIASEFDRAGPRDFLGIVAVAARPAVELAPTRKEDLGDWRPARIASTPATDQTDIAAALKLAAALVPETAAGRFVLLSDGNQTRGNALDYAPLLRAQGIDVFTRSMKTIKTQPEVAVREIDLPSALSEGEGFELKISVDSTSDTSGQLRVFRNNTVLTERPVDLKAGGDNVFFLPLSGDKKGFYTYRAQIDAAADHFVENNSREGLVKVQGRPKTLYLYGDPSPSPALARVLSEGSLDAELRPDSAVPTTLAGFQDYDLIIFDNVPASVLTDDQMKMLRSYVHDLGGGFIMIGGDKSFGAGGYYKTPVEDVLPVSLDLRNKKNFPSLALVFVIDKSGSMNETQGGRSKIELAIEASSAAVDALSERDSTGAVAFDTEAHTIVPLTRVEDKGGIARQLRTIQASGGTNIYSGLRAAYELLLASEAEVKHIILLSDGESEEGDYPGITRSMRQGGITLSSVAVGNEADVALMKGLADAGGGRFYQTNRPQNLSSIFTREAFLASKEAIVEKPFTARLVQPGAATNGIDWTSAPQLAGYVGTAERRAAGSDDAAGASGQERQQAGPAAIISLVSDQDDPVYAVWQYGLGRAGAFTSDAKPRWASDWMNWSGFGQFWIQALRDIIRREQTGNGLRILPRTSFDPTSGEGQEGLIEADVTDASARYVNDLAITAHIVSPNLTSQDLRLEQIDVGKYRARFAGPLTGPYVITLLDQNGQQLAATGGVKSYSAEFNISSEDVDLLNRISAETGGQSLDGGQGSDLFRKQTIKTVPTDIWDKLLIFALLILPIDAAIRRIYFSRHEIASAMSSVASRFRPRRARMTASEPEPGPVSAPLSAIRQRVRLGKSDDRADAMDIGSPGPAQQPGVLPAQPVTVVRTGEPVRPAPPAVKETSPARPLASQLLASRRKREETRSRETTAEKFPSDKQDD